MIKIKKKYKKIKWHILFNDKNFKYNLNSRNLNNITAYNLAEIIYPDITKHKFKKIINFLHKNITLKKKNKLLDFGSGNGAFLFFFQKKVSKLYSMEISKNFINFQKKILKKTKYFLTNPDNVSFYKNIKDNEIDTTISFSVFHYFYSNSYCENILREMIRTTRDEIFLFDIKDKKKKDKYIKNIIKRQKLSIKEYKNKYKNTPQRFYDKSFFIKFFKKNFPNLKYNFINLPKEATDSNFGYCLKIIKS